MTFSEKLPGGVKKDLTEHKHTFNAGAGKEKSTDSAWFIFSLSLSSH